MKKLWNKTKKSFAVGTAKVETAFTDKKIEDEPDFLDKDAKLKEMEASLEGLRKDAQQMCKILKKIGAVEGSTGKIIHHAFKDDTRKPLGEGAQEFGSKLEGWGTYGERYYVPTFVIAPVQQALDECKRLEFLKEKTKKNRILLNEEEAALRRAKELQKDVEKHESSHQRRKEKHEKYSHEFKTGVMALYEKRLELYERTYMGIQYYLVDMCALIEMGVKSKLPQFNRESLKGTYNTLCTPPPQGAMPPAPEKP